MMNKLLITTSTAALILALALGLRAGEHGEREYEHEEHREGRGPAGAVVSDPRAPLYRTECGDCHLAFPPALLPAGSWRAVMAGLEDHFGDNAELDPTTAREITGFLVQQAAGPGSGEYGSGPGAPPGTGPRHCASPRPTISAGSTMRSRNR